MMAIDLIFCSEKYETDNFLIEIKEHSNVLVSVLWL